MAEATCLVSCKFTQETLIVLDNSSLRDITFPGIRQLERLFIDIADAKIVERLDKKHIAVVPANKPYSISLWEVLDGQARLFLCFTDMVMIVDARSLSVLKEIHNKAPESDVMVLCRSTGQLAFPIDSLSGHVRIMPTFTEGEEVEILAHDSAIAAICFTNSGDRIATASGRGTVIRVFTIKGEKTHELRRGMTRVVTVSCMSFCRNDKYLTLASNTETVHVFEVRRPVASGWMGCLGSVAGVMGMGKVVEVCAKERAFATAHLPTTCGTGKVCSVVHIDEKPHVVVADLEGNVYIYGMPLETAEASQCLLLRHHRLSKSEDESEDTLSEYSTASSPVSFADYDGWKKGLKLTEKPSRPYASSAYTSDTP